MTDLEQLIGLLDRQIEMLQDRLALLHEMGDCVRHGRSERLEEIVRERGGPEAAWSSVSENTAGLRAALEAALGPDAGEATLGSLLEALDGAEAMALSDRRERLIALVGQLRAEAARTACLVGHAARFGQRLLAAITGADNGAQTYNAAGGVRGAGISTFGQTV